MKILKHYNSFNARRYGNPWVALVSKATAKPNFKIRVGGYTGGYNRGEAGDLYVTDPKDGSVYMYGQRDYRGHNTEQRYALYTGGEFVTVTPETLLSALAGEFNTGAPEAKTVASPDPQDEVTPNAEEAPTAVTGDESETAEDPANPESCTADKSLTVFPGGYRVAYVVSALFHGADQFVANEYTTLESALREVACAGKNPEVLKVELTRKYTKADAPDEEIEITEAEYSEAS